MKKVSIVAAATTALLASPAFAAQTKKAKVVSSKTLYAANASSRHGRTSNSKNAVARNTIPSTQIYRAKQSDAISTQRSSATRATLPLSGTTATTSAAVQSPMKKKSPFSIGANFYYYGSSVSEPFRGYQSNINEGSGYAGDPVSVETHFVFGYKVSDNITVSLNPYFTSNANHRVYNAETGTYDAQKGTFFALMSPFARVAFGKFVQRGNFKWNGDFRVYPGIGELQHELPIYLRTGQNFFFTLSPKLTFATYSTLRYYRYTNSLWSRNEGRRDFRVTAAPTLEYQVADSLGLSLAYNMDAFHPHRETNRGNWSPIHWTDNRAFFEAGLSWDVTKRVNLNPFIDVFPRNIKLYNTMLGVNLALSIL
jgi:hypothetical protein